MLEDVFDALFCHPNGRLPPFAKKAKKVEYPLSKGSQRSTSCQCNTDGLKLKIFTLLKKKELLFRQLFRFNPVEPTRYPKAMIFQARFSSRPELLVPPRCWHGTSLHDRMKKRTP